MIEVPKSCPECGSTEIREEPGGEGWTCLGCGDVELGYW
jgi:ribosomal protein L37AE/L43A